MTGLLSNLTGFLTVSVLFIALYLVTWILEAWLWKWGGNERRLSLVALSSFAIFFVIFTAVISDDVDPLNHAFGLNLSMALVGVVFTLQLINDQRYQWPILIVVALVLTLVLPFLNSFLQDVMVNLTTELVGAVLVFWVLTVWPEVVTTPDERYQMLVGGRNYEDCPEPDVELVSDSANLQNTTPLIFRRVHSYYLGTVATFGLEKELVKSICYKLARLSNSPRPPLFTHAPTPGTNWIIYRLKLWISHLPRFSVFTRPVGMPAKFHTLEREFSREESSCFEQVFMIYFVSGIDVYGKDCFAVFNVRLDRFPQFLDAIEWSSVINLNRSATPVVVGRGAPTKQAVGKLEHWLSDNYLFGFNRLSVRIFPLSVDETTSRQNPSNTFKQGDNNRLNTAWKYLVEGEFDKAVAEYDAILADGLGDKVINSVNKGLVLQALGRRSDAQHCFASAISKDPSYGIALYWQSLLYLEQRDFSRAKNDLVVYSTIDSGVVTYVYNALWLAVAEHLRGQPLDLQPAFNWTKHMAKPDDITRVQALLELLSGNVAKSKHLYGLCLEKQYDAFSPWHYLRVISTIYPEEGRFSQMERWYGSEVRRRAQI